MRTMVRIGKAETALPARGSTRSRLMRLIGTGLAIGLLSACQVLPDRDPARGPAPAPPAQADRGPVSAPLNRRDRQCIANLAARNARFIRALDRQDGPGCAYAGAVSLSSLAGDFGRIEVTRLGALHCSAADALTGWVRYGVDRAAREYLGSGVERVETMGSYSCRNVAGTSRRSGHARAEAIDIAAFVLDDGRRVSVLGDWSDGSRSEREFLRRIHESACKRFGTVLGPDYNAAHRDHFHVETGGGGYCR